MIYPWYVQILQGSYWIYRMGWLFSGSTINFASQNCYQIILSALRWNPSHDATTLLRFSVFQRVSPPADPVRQLMSEQPLTSHHVLCLCSSCSLSERRLLSSFRVWHSSLSIRHSSFSRSTSPDRTGRVRDEDAWGGCGLVECIFNPTAWGFKNHHSMFRIY